MEYCCNKVMQLDDQLVITDGYVNDVYRYEILALYNCVNCKVARGIMLRQNSDRTWTTPVVIKDKVKLYNLQKLSLASLEYRDTRLKIFVGEGTRRMASR